MAKITETIWPIEEHTKAKHVILRRYLSAWFAILGRNKPHVIYIDGFCGPGRYMGGEIGSPIIALTEALRQSDHLSNTEIDFIFIDEDRKRIEHLKKVLAETNANRDSIMKQLKYQPFMEPTQRLRYKKALPAYDTKIKRLKLDIQAAETISRMSQDDFDNPKIKTDYQHHPTRQATSKPDYKK